VATTDDAEYLAHSNHRPRWRPNRFSTLVRARIPAYSAPPHRWWAARGRFSADYQRI